LPCSICRAWREFTAKCEWDVRTELPEADAVVPQVEDQVAAGSEPALDDSLRDVVDGLIEVLDHAGEDELAQIRLVVVDADPVDAFLLGDLECAEAAGPATSNTTWEPRAICARARFAHVFRSKKSWL
jgi:hypothetical protein